ncbi:MAG TPA: hypothetical protein VM510_08670 [Caulifigura sp.]|nr:hypothetical protein [Caulifigura sp.]
MIGTWEVPKSLFQAEATRYQFSANGWGHRIEQPSALSLDEVGPYVQNFRWWVENDHLVLELNNRIGYERLLARLQSSIGPLFGYARQLHTEQFRIHDIRNDSLTMDVKTTYRTFILVGLMQPTTLKRVRQ